MKTPRRPAAILTDVLGFTEVAREGDVTRYRAANAASGGIVDLRAAGGFCPHAWARARCITSRSARSDDAAQAEMVQKLAENHGMRTTEQKDRNYFRSVYFREPATYCSRSRPISRALRWMSRSPTLGQALKLPPFLEKRRAEIEAVLPKAGVTSA